MPDVPADALRANWDERVRAVRLAVEGALLEVLESFSGVHPSLVAQTSGRVLEDWAAHTKRTFPVPTFTVADVQDWARSLEDQRLSRQVLTLSGNNLENVAHAWGMSLANTGRLFNIDRVRIARMFTE